MASAISPATLAALSSFLADAPEEITLGAVKRSPEMARLVILADQIGALVGRDTLDWLKTSGAGCDPVSGEAGAESLRKVAAEARDFIDERARIHRSQSRASRTWRKDYEAREAEKFEAHSDKLTKAILAAKGERG